MNEKRFSYLLLFNKESINKTSLIIFVQSFEMFYKSNLYISMKFISVLEKILVSP